MQDTERQGSKSKPSVAVCVSVVSKEPEQAHLYTSPVSLPLVSSCLHMSATSALHALRKAGSNRQLACLKQQQHQQQRTRDRSVTHGEQPMSSGPRRPACMLEELCVPSIYWVQAVTLQVQHNSKSTMSSASRNVSSFKRCYDKGLLLVPYLRCSLVITSMRHFWPKSGSASFSARHLCSRAQQCTAHHSTAQMA
jgi:hypothetical protein